MNVTPDNNITTDDNLENRAIPDNNFESKTQLAQPDASAKLRPDWTMIIIAAVTALILIIIGGALIFLQIQIRTWSSSFSESSFLEEFSTPVEDLAAEYGLSLDRSRSGWGGESFEWMSERQKQDRLRASAASGMNLEPYLSGHLEVETRWLIVDNSLDLESVRLIVFFDGDSFDENSNIVGAYVEINYSLVISLEAASTIEGFTPEGTVSFSSVFADYRTASDDAAINNQVNEVELITVPGLLAGAAVDGPEFVLVEYLIALAAGDAQRAEELSARPDKWLIGFDLEQQRMHASISEDTTSMEVSSIRDASSEPGWPLDQAMGQFPNHTDISCFSPTITTDGRSNNLFSAPFYMGINEEGRWEILLPSDAWDW